MPKLVNPIARTIATAVAVAAVALPVGWALAPASAAPVATTATTSPDTTDTTAPPTSHPPKAERQADRRADRQARLAEHLGVTTDELKDARLAVLQELLDERFANGRISPERAEQVMEAARSGTLKELRRQLRAERAARR